MDMCSLAKFVCLGLTCFPVQSGRVNVTSHKTSSFDASPAQQDLMCLTMHENGGTKQHISDSEKFCSLRSIEKALA